MVISFVTDKSYQKNKIFDQKDPTRAKYVALRDEFKNLGFDFITSDLVGDRPVACAIFHDLKKGFKSDLDVSIKNYALLIESPLVRPESYNSEHHHLFSKIFTRDDNLVSCNQNKYVKIQYSFKIDDDYPIRYVGGKKLCTLIVSNKLSVGQHELYSERRRLIRWFEKNAPDDFALFGRGWNHFVSKLNILNRVIKRTPLLQKLFDTFLLTPFPSYCGEVDNKLAVMSKFSFSIAYENIIDQRGYITEKIFDSLFAGCIPVYLGAPNISEYVPENCFIDRRKFDTNEALYEFMKNLTLEQHFDYQNNIERFLVDDARREFSVKTFAETVVASINSDSLGQI
jgi:hypothetical protein